MDDVLYHFFITDALARTHHCTLHNGTTSHALTIIAMALMGELALNIAAVRFLLQRLKYRLKSTLKEKCHLFSRLL